MKTWEIRTARQDDAPGLKACMESAYAVYRERTGGKRLPPMDADYDSEIRNHPAWVAASDEGILGGLIMLFGKDATVANIAVDPGFQGRGIGAALLRLAETEARSRGYSEIRLATHVLLVENVSLYRHLGWTEISRDETRIHMKKGI